MIGFAVCVSLGSAAAGQTAPFRLADEWTPRKDIATVADLDGDADADILLEKVGTLVNDGHGRLTNGAPSTWSCGLWIQPYDLARTKFGLADFNGDGLADLIKRELGGGVGLHFGLAGGGFTMAFSGGCEPAGVPIAIGANAAISVACGDVDNDGDADAVVGCLFGGYTPTSAVLLLNVGGTLSMAGGSWGFAAVTPPIVALEDLDGDGWLDLVAVDGSPVSAVVQRNLGGTFAPPVSLPTTGLVPLPGNPPGMLYSVPRPAVADLDGDGLKEIFLRQGATGSSLLLRQTAPFAFSVVASLPGYGADSTLPIGAVAGDFDGDGVGELALATSTGVTFSQLSGGALVPGGPTIPRVFMGLRKADADQDGDLDLFTTTMTSYGYETEIGFNDGAGAFVFPERAITTLPWTAVFDKGDFDGDGDLDVVGYRATAADGSTTGPFVALNRGDGTFTTPTDVPCVGCPPLGYGTQSGLLTQPPYISHHPVAKVFDSDLDGDLDIVVIRTGDPTGATDLWLRNDGPAGFVAVPLAAPPTILKTGQSFLATDLDGDGDRDLVFTATPTSAFVRYNLGASFGPGLVLPVPVPVTDVAADDLDGDGDPDLVFSRQVYPTNGWFYVVNNLPQGGGLVAGAPTTTGRSISRILLADLNGDGKPDVVANDARWLNLGGFAFSSAAPVVNYSTTPDVIEAFDVEGDGDLDLYASPLNYTSLGTGHIAVNNGTGGFTTLPVTTPLSGLPQCVADFDLDGDADFMVAGPTMLAGTTRHLALRRPARPGRPAGFDVYGPANGQWLVAAQIAPATFASVPTPYGGLALDPGLAVLLAVGPLDAAGTAVFEATLPSSPVAALVGTEFVFQGVVAGLSGPRLTNPRRITVLDY